MVKKIDTICDKFSEICANCQYPQDKGELKKLVERYKDLLPNKEKYIKDLHEEYENKEIDKEKLFKEATLNIKLGKFTGYGSKKDIYTFQDEFEKKMYKRSTPAKYLPDLLQNNFLEGSVTSWVSKTCDLGL